MRVIQDRAVTIVAFKLMINFLRRHLSKIAVATVSVLLLWFVLRSVSWSEVFDTFRNLNWYWLIGVVVITVVAHVVVSARWWYLLWGFGYRLPFWRTVRYRATVYTLSYIVPGPQLGGEVLQVYYPAKKHHVPTAASITAATVDKSLEFLGNFSFIVVGVIVMLVGQRVVSGADLYAMVVVSALMLVPAVVLVFVARGRHPLSALVLGTRSVIPAAIRRWLRRSFASLPSLEHMYATVFHSEELMAWLWRQRKSAILMALFLTVVALVLVAVDFWMVAEAIGLGLTKTQTIGTMVMVYFAYLLPVPGGLGAIEAAVVLSFTTFGFSTAQALSVALIMRVRDTLQAAIGLALGGFDSLRSVVESGTSDALLGDDADMTVEEAEEIVTGHISPLQAATEPGMVSGATQTRVSGNATTLAAGSGRASPAAKTRASAAQLAPPAAASTLPSPAPAAPLPAPAAPSAATVVATEATRRTGDGN